MQKNYRCSLLGIGSFKLGIFIAKVEMLQMKNFDKFTETALNPLFMKGLRSNFTSN